MINTNSSNLVFIAEPWMCFFNFLKNWLNHVDLKPFDFNNRLGLLSNLWCFCKTHMNHVVFCCDDQHVYFTIQIQNKTTGFSAIYASTSYLHRRELWNNLTIKIPNTIWCFIGNYNVIISFDEHKGSHSPARASMNNFFN